MNKRIQIFLPQEKRDYALELALQRNKKEKRFGGKTYNNTMTAQNSHNMGILAEAAVAHHYNVDIDSRIFNNKGDDGVDLVIPRFGNVAVKSTTYWDEPLLRAEVKRDYDIIDYYFLVYVSKALDETWLIGYTTRTDLHAKGVQKKLGRFLPLNWIMTEKNLKKIRVRV